MEEGGDIGYWNIGQMKRSPLPTPSNISVNNSHHFCRFLSEDAQDGALFSIKETVNRKTMVTIMY